MARAPGPALCSPCPAGTLKSGLLRFARGQPPDGRQAPRAYLPQARLQPRTEGRAVPPARTVTHLRRHRRKPEPREIRSLAERSWSVPRDQLFAHAANGMTSPSPGTCSRPHRWHNASTGTSPWPDITTGASRRRRRPDPYADRNSPNASTGSRLNILYARNHSHRAMSINSLVASRIRIY